VTGCGSAHRAAAQPQTWTVLETILSVVGFIVASLVRLVV
jgi:H+/gluconate symporter-like permease